MRNLMFIPPMLQMIVFGFSVNLDVERASMGWMDMDRTAESMALRRSFEASHYIAIDREINTQQEGVELLDAGKLMAVVRIPAGFAADVTRGRQTEVQVLVDGANSNSASIVANYAGGVIAQHNRELLASLQEKRLVGRGAAGPVRMSMPGLRPETRVWFNAELKSRNYFVPGVVVNIIMLVTIMLTALSVVREKEIGTMEQIMVTPIKPLELILGKTIPFAIVGLIDMVLVVTIALLVFRVPFRGSFLLLFGASLLFLLTTLGVGLFLSTVSDTQQQAMMGAFFFFQPAFMLSGFTFPIRNMPEAIQWLTYINPMRYFMEIVRGVFLKGSGVDILWPHLLALAVFGTAILLLSANRFRKRLD